MDWLPTLLSVAGIKNEDKLDGVDISSILFNQKELNERAVFWRYRNQLVVRKGDWKYLKNNEGEFLFNLKDDLGEKNNLIVSNKDRADDLKNLLKEWESEMGEYKQQTD